MISLRTLLLWGWRQRRRLVVLTLILLAAWSGKMLYDRLTASEAKWRREMAAGERLIDDYASNYNPRMAAQHFERALHEARKFGTGDQRYIDAEVRLVDAYFFDRTFNSYFYRQPGEIITYRHLLTRHWSVLSNRLQALQQQNKFYRREKCINTMLKHAVAEQERISGRDSPRLIAPLIRLAYFEQLMNHSEDLNLRAHRAMMIWDHRKVKVDLNTAEYFCYLSHTYEYDPKSSRKIPESLLLRSLAMAESSYGPHDQHLHYILVELKEHYQNNITPSDSTKVIYYYKRTWDVRHRRCGENHPGYLTGLANLLPDITAKEKCYKRAINHLNKCTLSHGYDTMPKVLESYASFLHNQGRFAEEKYYRKYAATGYPPGHP